MSSRAVLLPTPGDPLLLHYWLENYRKFYKNEVDKLYVLLNTPIEKPVVDYIQEMLKEVGADFIYIDHQIEHGDAINRLLDMCKEDFVVLVEDDCYLIRGGKINECFLRLENNEVDAVVGKRNSCDKEISTMASELWHISYEGYGDQGCNFWPNMFFSKKETLLNTDRNFGARQWNKGEMIAPLNHIATHDCASDTFVNTSLQLRSRGLRFYYENQYHASPNDPDDYHNHFNLWDGNAPWVHIGSLSSGVGGILMDDQGRPLARRMIDGASVNPRTLPSAGVDEWARRIQMWQTFYDHSDPDKIPEFREEYRKALERLYRLCQVPVKLVTQRQAMYREIGL
jgi:hypothetical protein